MTGMVTSYLEKSEDEPEKLNIVKDESKQETPEEPKLPEAVPVSAITVPVDKVPFGEEPVEPVDEPVNDPINEPISEPINEPVNEEPVKETDELKEVLKSILSKDTKNPEELTIDEVKNAVKEAQEKQEPIEEPVNEEPKRKSHFVNLKNETTS
jgi:hypothetical protein